MQKFKFFWIFLKLFCLLNLFRPIEIILWVFNQKSFPKPPNHPHDLFRKKKFVHSLIY